MSQLRNKWWQSAALGLAVYSLSACSGGGSSSAAGGSPGTGGQSDSGNGGSINGGATSDSNGGNNDATGGQASSNKGGGTGQGGSNSTGTGGKGGGTSAGGSTSSTIPVVPGTVDPNAPADTALPALPRLYNVKAQAIGDSATITFEPVDAAVDYRVYELPANGDISTTTDGHVTVKNAVYRCAGNRQAPKVPVDGAPQVASGAVHTFVDGQKVQDFKRTLADATLGYVFTEPGDGRIPVYALGDNNPKADNDCYFQRWTASRLKQYVTSTDARDALLKKGFRDDGIAFYVPATASADTVQISGKAEAGDFGYQLYFVDGSAEAKARSGSKPAFLALAKATTDATPLMRVYYDNICGNGHDELVAGTARFNMVRNQGDQYPLTSLHWAGLKGPTTLVVEALDQGCPFPGLLAPVTAPAYDIPDFDVFYKPWVTFAGAQSSAPNNELFINGQFDGTNPRPIARSFVKIGPAAAPSLDWSFGFKPDDSFGTFKNTACGVADGNCWGQSRWLGDHVDTAFINVEDKRFGHGGAFGEWWVAFSDISGDTTGKYRLTPDTRGDMTSDSFLYVGMDVDAFSTLRRYPQILISDQLPPVQINLEKGNTLVLQTFADWPNTYELQVCNHKTWDVNDQCPRFDFYHQYLGSDPTVVTGLAPNAEVGEQVGMDKATRFEIYASTKRAYLFLDGKPYGCADLPSAGVPKGTVTVTFGDVMYHSGVDALFAFTEKHYHWDTVRHFDNMGYKSHVAAPAWDEARFPCKAPLQDNN